MDAERRHFAGRNYADLRYMKATRSAVLCAAFCMTTLAGVASGVSLEQEPVPWSRPCRRIKFDFSPTHGEFTAVRTFALQAKHVAYIICAVSAARLELGRAGKVARVFDGFDDGSLQPDERWNSAGQPAIGRIAGEC